MRENWWLIMNWIGVDSFILSLVLMAKVEEFIPYSIVVIVSMLLLFVVTKHISHLWCLKSLTQELVRMYSMILKLELLMTMMRRGNTDRWWPWWWKWWCTWRYLSLFHWWRIELTDDDYDISQMLSLKCIVWFLWELASC